MCGLWGFSGVTGPDPAYLDMIAGRAARRGPHAWGCAWATGDDTVTLHRELIPYRRRRNPPDVRRAIALVGHARLATSGSSASLVDTQPLARPGYAVGHNGNVSDHLAIAKALKLDLETDCDSELIIATLERTGWTPSGIAQAFACVGRIPHCIIALHEAGALAVSRSYQPLYFEARSEGTYFGQAPWDGAEMLPENTITIFREGIMETTTRPPEHPISNVRWVDPATLTANDYNPNKVFPPEMRLLKVSILESGWTQPVVVTPEMQIIDGYHRWTLASRDEEIIAASNGMVPIVVSKPVDEASRIMATVRHNRARGAHGITAMGRIVAGLMEEGLGEKEIMTRLGMEKEEVRRLADFRRSPDKSGKDSFGKGWKPIHD